MCYHQHHNGALRSQQRKPAPFSFPHTNYFQEQED